MSSCLALAAVGMHLASIHSEAGYNDFNPGAYIETQCGITAGAFYNSFKKLSVHVNYTYDVPKVPLFILGGAITGYTGGWHGIKPIAMVGVRATVSSYRLRIGYIPEVPGLNRTHIVHFMIEKRF